MAASRRSSSSRPRVAGWVLYRDDVRPAVASGARLLADTGAPLFLARIAWPEPAGWYSAGQYRPQWYVSHRRGEALVFRKRWEARAALLSWGLVRRRIGAPRRVRLWPGFPARCPVHSGARGVGRPGWRIVPVWFSGKQRRGR